ncbi:hypothetical protein A3762_13080 [Oleiphilus sp. HI0125]|uniref:WD40/YVTN/BNR-like repeat-containing protein n=1 Tax=Oleiphilus sp. HI0125 TaxID=1822266 RepID=UPI0007C2A331|nr:YCF48-related protein [Oleiphilus sp. HI0125]KZZ62620.1 hypothetical protein A3762_13080 [Oleiphilus sp. HI0125]
MNSIFHRCFGLLGGRKLAQAFIGASVVGSSFSLHAMDVLNTPSYPSELASEYLLVDIENLGQRLVAVGARGHIIHSDSRGSSWQQADVPVSVLLTAVDFVSSDKGWAVGHGGVILHSNDGGLSWVKQFDGNQANQSIIEQAEAYIAELEFELDESGGSDEDLEYELEDAQYALEDAELDAEIGASKPFLDVAFLTDTHGFAVGAYGFLFETTDGGRTWENAGDRLDNLDRFHLNAIKVLEGGNLIIAGEAGVLFTSSDKGQSWDTVNSPYEGSFFGVLPLKDKNSALVFGLRGNLFKTVNAGRSWSKVDSGTESSLMGGALDGNKQISITGNAGTVIVSNDGGETFSSYSRADRLGHTAMVYITRDRLALVGESGVELVSPSGKNL